MASAAAVAMGARAGPPAAMRARGVKRRTPASAAAFARPLIPLRPPQPRGLLGLKRPKHAISRGRARVIAPATVVAAASPTPPAPLPPPRPRSPYRALAAYLDLGLVARAWACTLLALAALLALLARVGGLTERLAAGDLPGLLRLGGLVVGLLTLRAVATVRGRWGGRERERVGLVSLVACLLKTARRRHGAGVLSLGPPVGRGLGGESGLGGATGRGVPRLAWHLPSLQAVCSLSLLSSFCVATGTT